VIRVAAAQAPTPPLCQPPEACAVEWGCSPQQERSPSVGLGAGAGAATRTPMHSGAGGARGRGGESPGGRTPPDGHTQGFHMHSARARPSYIPGFRPPLPNRKILMDKQKVTRALSLCWLRVVRVPGAGGNAGQGKQGRQAREARGPGEGGGITTPIASTHLFSSAAPRTCRPRMPRTRMRARAWAAGAAGLRGRASNVPGQNG
jgi:hypothetical protein